LDLVIVELSLFLEPAGPAGPFRAFLVNLTRIVHPNAILVVEDVTPGNLDWQRLSREFLLNIRPWDVVLEAAREIPEHAGSFTNLVFDMPSMDDPDGRARIVLVLNNQAEGGYHCWDMDRQSSSTLASLTAGANSLDHNAAGHSWPRFALEYGRAFRELLRSLRSVSPCSVCSRPSENPCVLDEVICGCAGTPAAASVMSLDKGPLVSVAPDWAGPLAPVEFLPWPWEDGLERCLYEVKPVMHQLLQHGPPCGHVSQRPLRDTNFLLICANSAGWARKPLPEAEKEVNDLYDSLTRSMRREKGSGTVAKFLSRKYDSFSSFQARLRSTYPKVRWHVVHWAGHAFVKDGDTLATFDWPASTGSGTLRHDEVERFVRQLNQKTPEDDPRKDLPLLLHFSCCSVGGTGSPAKFVMLGVPYVLAHRWQLRDDEAAQFVEHFYQNWLLFGMHPAVALWKTRQRNLHRAIAASSVLLGGSYWKAWR
jgi:hypothetical protein